MTSPLHRDEVPMVPNAPVTSSVQPPEYLDFAPEDFELEDAMQGGAEPCADGVESADRIGVQAGAAFGDME